jgi:signal transduction histidine kinase
MQNARLRSIIAGGSIDARMIAMMRLVLASSALLIIFIDPSEPDQYVSITYCLLVLYVVYSAILYYLALRQNRFWSAIDSRQHWIDIGWYLTLISLSSGTNSIFFFFFFFSILIASFRQGFISGLNTTVVSSVLFPVIGYLTAPQGQEFELNRFLLRPIYLLVLGYMMAYWGGSEIKLKRRLALLKEIAMFSNPRFGIGRTIEINLKRQLAFYDADACLLVMRNSDTSEFELHRSYKKGVEAGIEAESIDPELLRRLLELSSEYAAVYSKQRGRERWANRCFLFDVIKGERANRGEVIARKLADLLDAESYITVPLQYHNRFMGRIYLISHKRNTFDNSDIEFLLQIYEHLIPIIDNTMLVDRLASRAAEEERQRIARNIHDSIIQPYLGLQIGLSTVSQKLSTAVSDGNSEELAATVTTMSNRIERLLEMTNIGITDLRNYISGLRQNGDREGSLLPSVRRFASRFSEATGIAVRVDVKANIIINDRLTAEVFQMIVEGLSNIRRHTEARNAVIELACSNGHLILRIENDGASRLMIEDFNPRSISGRAEALGSMVYIERPDSGRTVVVVEIPL